MPSPYVSITEKRKTMMASKDNKHKYADSAEEEAEESMAPPKKQRTMNGDDDDGGSSSSTDDFSSELEEEEMNLPADSDEKVLIQRARSDDGDTSDSENNNSIKNDGDTSDDGSDND
jgi:hypothetical protein